MAEIRDNEIFIDSTETLQEIDPRYIPQEKWKEEVNKISVTWDEAQQKGFIHVPDTVNVYDNNRLHYLKLNITVTPYIDVDGKEVEAGSFDQNIGFVVDRSKLSDPTVYDELLTNGFFLHGRAGVFDEVDYFDGNPLNNITPTKWYYKQEPFEFEFVVNNLVGAHKIFNDLVIISNNVQPKTLEFEIIGDVYGFNKAGIFWDNEWSTTYNPPKTDRIDGSIIGQKSQSFDNVSVKWDPVLNQYSLVVTEEAKNINSFGRRAGNIQYKEDAWYMQIDPIKYTEKFNNDESIKEDQSTRIRDKFLKVRVKYSGEDLAIITALKTMMTVSYA